MILLFWRERPQEWTLSEIDRIARTIPYPHKTQLTHTKTNDIAPTMAAAVPYAAFPWSYGYEITPIER
jgi:hypothetical protein